MSVFGRFYFFRFLSVSFSQNQALATKQSSSFESLDTEKIVKTLRQDGVYSGIKLPQFILEQVLDFAYKTECYGDAEHHLGFFYYQKELAEKACSKAFNLAQYFNVDTHCPAIARLSKDPLLLEIAQSYIGAKPVYTGSRLWWIFAVEQAEYNPNKVVSFFHYDLDDYRCLRFFFYLTDVDLNSGPHVCVLGSQNHKKFTHLLSPIKRRSDQEIVNFYGKERIVTLRGKAGWGFAEDTFCYHKATPPLRRDRLMLQVQFALKDYGVHHDRAQPSLLKKICI